VDIGSRNWVSFAAFLVTGYLMWHVLQQAPTQLREPETAPRLESRTLPALPDPSSLLRSPFLEPGTSDPTAAKKEDPAVAWNLEGVVRSGSKRWALINGTAVRPGDVYSGFLVDSVLDDRVVLSHEGKSVEITAAKVVEEKRATGDVRLTAILTSSKGKAAAIVNGSVVHEGETVVGYLVESIQANTVMLSREGQPLELKVRNDPPSAVHVPPSAVHVVGS
jgi:type II secretory pathway component PulC